MVVITGIFQNPSISRKPHPTEETIICAFTHSKKDKKVDDRRTNARISLILTAKDATICTPLRKRGHFVSSL